MEPEGGLGDDAEGAVEGGGAGDEQRDDVDHDPLCVGVERDRAEFLEALAARGVWREVEVPELGTSLRLPGGWYRLAEAPR